MGVIGLTPWKAIVPYDPQVSVTTTVSECILYPATTYLSHAALHLWYSTSGPAKPIVRYSRTSLRCRSKRSLGIRGITLPAVR